MAVSYFEHSTDDYKITYENNNAIGYRSQGASYWFDLIKGRCGTPDQILDMFDFTVTKFALYRDTKVSNNVIYVDDLKFDIVEPEYKVIYHPKFFEHLVTKKLVIDDQLLFPISTFNRTYRYRDYGYHLCRESKIKLLTELKNVEDVIINSDMYEALD